MVTPYRTLRPVPGADGQPQIPAMQMQPAGRNRASQACQPCREKRRRCPGERPECGECAKRLLRCVYETQPGQTRMAALRCNNERMRSDLDTMLELYWYLQTKPKEEAGEALLAIQTGATPSQVMEFIKNRTSWSDATPGSNSTVAGTTQIESGSASDCDRVSESESPALSQEPQPLAELSAVRSPAGELPIESDLPQIIESLKKGIQAFFICTSSIFHIYDQDEAQKMLDRVGAYLENAGKSWLELVFQGSIPPDLKPPLCSLCIIAAVGLQYTKNAIPALGFKPSSSDGSYEFVSVFYESARHLLEAVIELDVMEATKVCAALCVFNTIGHATVAMSYADMGINFVLSIGPTLQYDLSGPKEAAWVEYKRVVRTLVTLRSWLIATLGYVHRDNPELQSGINRLIDSRDLTPNETIQHELNKVVQIESNLLRTMNSVRTLSPALLSSTRRDLAQWHEQLPSWMQLSAFVGPSESTVEMRRTVFLVHLFYLSANILLARLAHGGQKSLPPLYEVEEVRVAVGDGVHAARTAARILQLKMDEGALFQRCWCCEFAAYVSALVLLHSAAHMQLHGFPQLVWQQELSYVQPCIFVLEYCAKTDPVAERFAEVTSGYYNTLVAHLQPDDNQTADTPETLDYLFSIPPTSPTHLANTSRDLLKHISCPFDSPSSLHDEGTLKAGLGAHISLPFNYGPPDSSNSWSTVQTALSGMPTGQFVVASQPHGWDVFPSWKKL